MKLYEDAVLNACADLLPEDVYNNSTDDELISKYMKFMGYYYGIMTSLAMKDELHKIDSIESEDWVALYNEVKVGIQFRPKYKINPQFYYDWIDDMYKVAFGSEKNQISYSYKHATGSRFVATYTYLDDMTPVPYLHLLAVAEGEGVENEFDIFNHEMADSVIEEYANITQSNRMNLKEVELVAMVADGQEMICVFKTGRVLKGNIGKKVEDIEPTHEGELLVLY